MKYGTGWGVMDTYWARLSARSSGSTRYSVTITIPMKGDHGVQAVQYRKGKKVSQVGDQVLHGPAVDPCRIPGGSA